MKELNAIIEYELARREVCELKKPLSDLFYNCDHESYPGKNNCLKLKSEYHKWETGGYEYGDEPEHRGLCESCEKALNIYELLRPAKQRFGVAKTRLSAIARQHLNQSELMG